MDVSYSFSSNSFDLLHKQLTPDDYRNKKFSSSSVDGVVEFSSSEQPPAKGYMAGITRFISHLAKDDSQQLLESKEVIDQVARKFLEQDLYSLESDALNAGKTPEERLHDIDKRIQQVQNLLQNLKTHDLVLSEIYDPMDAMYATSSQPSSHDEVEAIAERQLEKLSELSHKFEAEINELQKNAETHFQALLGNLEENIFSGFTGLTIDRPFVWQNYNRIEKSLEHLPAEKRNDLLRQLNSTINGAYLTQRMSIYRDGHLKFSNYLQAICKVLGFSAKDAIAILNDKDSAHQTRLKTLLSDDVSLQNLSPIDLMDIVEEDLQNVFIDEYFKTHPEPSSGFKERFKEVILEISKIENQVRGQDNIQIENARQELLEKNKNSEDIEAIRTILYARTPRHLNEMGKTLIEMITLKDLDNPEVLKKTLARIEELKMDFLKRKDEDIKAKFVQELEKAISDQACLRIRAWLAANKKNKVFSFCQSDFGSDKILGEGVCLAVNYRWMKWLMRAPGRLINSVHDFDGEPGRPTVEKEGITAKDRLIQAQHRVGIRLGGDDERHGIPKFVLDKDGLYDAVEIDGTSVEDCIDKITEERATISALTNNDVFEIVGFGEEGGHAMCTQIGMENGLYHFGDVNIGFYKYHNLNETKNAIKEYMSAMYEFNSYTFRAYSDK